MSNLRVNCNPDCSSHNHRLMSKTILRCGHGMGAGPLLLSNNEDRCGQRERRTIASVNLDTRKLMEPTIKIDFFSIISFETNNDDHHELRLVFRLIKICKEEAPIPLGEWVFERSSQHGGNYATGFAKPEVTSNNSMNHEIEESNSFCFSWCECQEERENCRFIVEIVRQEGHDMRVNINNITLTALAVGFEEM